MEKVEPIEIDDDLIELGGSFIVQLFVVEKYAPVLVGIVSEVSTEVLAPFWP